MTISRCSRLDSVSISFCTARVPCMLRATGTSCFLSATRVSTWAHEWEQKWAREGEHNWAQTEREVIGSR